MKPKAIILKTDGINCDEEMQFAFELAEGLSEIVHVNQIFSSEKKLSDYQILGIPGGFSYGDDVMSGKILANQLLYRIGDELQSFVNSDKLVIGICNGFQVLVRTGLLPFGGKPAEEASLIVNSNAKFMSQWEGLKVQESKCVFTKGLSGKTVEYPIAHGEGKFIVKNDSVFDSLKQNNQIVFTYTNNPNGSVADIAGICNESGKILGLMPHPERYILKTQYYNWRRISIPPADEGREAESRKGFNSPQGLPIFQNAVRYFTD
ncbi:MAG: phosphoribosylformylglycinamidine synthase I [Candidatus Doudnabacteria bacterium CG10_big_fil_rev_8_21_14_0_10_41_10]|uniref:Phosphoribosylformylglycinamidine synthase I n=1 Tax=Candidatus Doudnabacteria bacterium CG10_big_fil_rev_8_21_14_0_10_41_10 TaxID=1974551 RepID=A0A2H0VEA5_9BACT|nr:MAG: phosphoribosylformylglycinamidine synthase I [Candidatus Doudnabacteria bacterium CG10_big_fil_rev_8_21_14_0_10_41_10]